MCGPIKPVPPSIRIRSDIPLDFALILDIPRLGVRPETAAPPLSNPSFSIVRRLLSMKPM